jgi:hypothetical protein
MHFQSELVKQIINIRTYVKDYFLVPYYFAVHSLPHLHTVMQQWNFIGRNCLWPLTITNLTCDLKIVFFYWSTTTKVITPSTKLSSHTPIFLAILYCISKLEREKNASHGLVWSPRNISRAISVAISYQVCENNFVSTNTKLTTSASHAHVFRMWTVVYSDRVVVTVHQGCLCAPTRHPIQQYMTSPLSEPRGWDRHRMHTEHIYMQWQWNCTELTKYVTNKAQNNMYTYVLCNLSGHL